MIELTSKCVDGFVPNEIECIPEGQKKRRIELFCDPALFETQWAPHHVARWTVVMHVDLVRLRCVFIRENPHLTPPGANRAFD